MEIRKKREEEKKWRVYTCLADDCKFEGNYHAMLKHKRKYHREEKLEEILYPEEREAKMKHDSLKKLVLMMMNRISGKYIQQAFLLYTQSHGQCPPKHLIKMFEHIEVCKHNCKQVII